LPEQKARRRIDALLRNAGWIVQDITAIDLTAGRGVAVREFPTATGPTDYLLFVDRQAIGTAEAKKERRDPSRCRDTSRSLQRRLR
jgi:type I restriction enzyme R subunit